MANPLENLIKEALSTARRAQRIWKARNPHQAMPFQVPVPDISTLREGQTAALEAAGLGISMAQKIVALAKWMERNLHVFRKIFPKPIGRPPFLRDPNAAEFAAPLRPAARTAEDEETMEADGDQELLMDADPLLFKEAATREEPVVSLHDLNYAITIGLETCRRLAMRLSAMAAADRRATRKLQRVRRQGEEATVVRMPAMEAAALNVRCVLRVVQSWVALMQETLGGLESDEASTRRDFAA